MENAFTPEANRNPLAELYREKLREHLRSGLPGFVIGFVIGLGFFGFVGVGTGFFSGTNLLEKIEGLITVLIAACVWGWAGAVVPYGWKLLNCLSGGWFITGGIVVVIFAYFAKFAFSFGAGMIGYPVMLAYYFIRSRKTKNRVRFWAVVIIGAVVLFYAFLGIYMVMNAKSNAAEINAAAGAVRYF